MQQAVLSETPSKNTEVSLRSRGRFRCVITGRYDIKKLASHLMKLISSETGRAIQFPVEDAVSATDNVGSLRYGRHLGMKACDSRPFQVGAAAAVSEPAPLESHRHGEREKVTLAAAVLHDAAAAVNLRANNNEARNSS